MNKVIVRKMYRVFDELHANEASAKEVLKGWEHKEKVSKVFAVGYENELNKELVTDLRGIYLAKTLKEAQEEAEEMNN
jgi:hypothetical protein